MKTWQMFVETMRKVPDVATNWSLTGHVTKHVLTHHTGLVTHFGHNKISIMSTLRGAACEEISAVFSGLQGEAWIFCMDEL